MNWHATFRVFLALAWEVFWRAIVPAGMVLGVGVFAVMEWI